MRLAIGWHFYSEGLEKLEPGFSSAGLLSASVGPLHGFYESFVPSPGDYEANLATPRQWGAINSQQAAENADWLAAYKKTVADTKKANAEAKKAGEPQVAMPVEFAPHSPYSEWAAEIVDQWANKRDKAARIAKDKDGRRLAEDIYRTHLAILNEYLSTESEAIEEFRHELWRLQEMQQKPGAEELAFREERIAEKKAETWRTARSWKAGVTTLEHAYTSDLVTLAGDERSAWRKLRSPSSLDWIDPLVTCVVLGVGVCMMLGFCTRLAGIVGAGFLLSVMATQPPWVVGANTEYLGYQMAEVGAMLTLAATGAGRWYGLDSLFCRCCSAFCGPNHK